MTSPSYEHCPNDCGEFRDTSGRYTSPANRELDRKWWQEEHLSGKCKTVSIDDATADPASLPRIESEIAESETTNVCDMKETRR